MTPEEKYGAKIFGTAIAVVILWIVVLAFGPRVINSIKALDDGPAHRPSDWQRRK